MNILFIGDIIGRPGRTHVRDNLAFVMDKYNIDFVIANGENASGGLGITQETYKELISMGIDVITLGNHAWSKRDTAVFIVGKTNIIKPANYSNLTPGKGYTIIEKNKKRVCVINLSGRVFLDCCLCPFVTVDRILDEVKGMADYIIVDIHAEATSEKIALGHYLNGRVTAVIGTHTHVQTADEKILSEGTAYITDAGMTGPHDSVLGVDKNIIIKKFLDGMPAKFDVAKEDVHWGAVVVTADDYGKAENIKRLQ